MSESAPKMPKGLDGNLESALLQLANAETLSYVEWCKEKISECQYTAQLPPKPWAGRDDVINACSQHFKNPDMVAMAAAVDLAVTELWAQQQDDPVNFKRRTMIFRLRCIRQLVLSSLNNGKREMFVKYQFVTDLPEPQRAHMLAKNPDPMAMIEVKVKQKIYTGVDMGAIHMLVQIERMVADLEDLYGNTGKAAVNVVQAMFDMLENRAKIDSGEPVASSMAAIAKNRKMGDESKPMMMLGSIVTGEGASTRPKNAKVIKSHRKRKRMIDLPPMQSATPTDEDGNEREE